MKLVQAPFSFSHPIWNNYASINNNTDHTKKKALTNFQRAPTPR